jgi:hypothetical protein
MCPFKLPAPVRRIEHTQAAGYRSGPWTIAKREVVQALSPPLKIAEQGAFSEGRNADRGGTEQRHCPATFLG